MSLINRLQALGICTNSLEDFAESGPVAKMQPHEARRVVAERTGVKLLGLPSLQVWSDLVDVVFDSLDDTPDLAVAFLVLAPEGADALVIEALRDVESATMFVQPHAMNGEPSGFAALGA